MFSTAFTIRPAIRSDIAILEALAERSIRGLAGGHYDPHGRGARSGSDRLRRMELAADTLR